MTPHPQRCETCKSKSCWFSPIYDTKINRLPSNISKWDEYVVVKNFTSVYGCASHSSAPTEQEIREQTLKDVWTLLEKNRQIDGNDQYYLWMEDIECMLDSLRTPTPETGE